MTDTTELSLYLNDINLKKQFVYIVNAIQKMNSLKSLHLNLVSSYL